MDKNSIFELFTYKPKKRVLEHISYSKLFDQDVHHHIYCPIINYQTEEQEIRKEILVTDYIAECINHFNNLTPEFKAYLKSRFFEIFNHIIPETSYGMVPTELLNKHNNDYGAANREFFGGYTEEDVFSKAVLKYVLYDNDEAPEISYNIGFEVPWEMEHGIHVCISNGEVYSVE